MLSPCLNPVAGGRSHHPAPIIVSAVTVLSPDTLEGSGQIGKTRRVNQIIEAHVINCALPYVLTEVVFLYKKESSFFKIQVVKRKAFFFVYLFLR